MKEVLKGLEISMGVSTDIKFERRCPALVNSEEKTTGAILAASLTAGSEKVYTNIPPVMNSEDFALMLECAPGAFMAIGAGMPRPNGMLHQPGFDFNDRILASGANYWVNLVESMLPPATED
jgi:hippurate hydrolase